MYRVFCRSPVVRTVLSSSSGVKTMSVRGLSPIQRAAIVSRGGPSTASVRSVSPSRSTMSVRISQVSAFQLAASLRRLHAQPSSSVITAVAERHRAQGQRDCRAISTRRPSCDAESAAAASRSRVFAGASTRINRHMVGSYRAERGQRCERPPRRRYAKMSFTTCPCTSVRRKSRPWKRNVRRSWSRPRRCRMVACRSWTWTAPSTTL